MFLSPGSRHRPRASGPRAINGDSSAGLTFSDGRGETGSITAQHLAAINPLLGQNDPGIYFTSSNTKIQIGALGGAGNPQLIVVDTNAFGVPVLGGGNQSGIGMVEAARPGSGSPVAFNFVNLGGTSATGAENSCALNIWGTSSGTGTQNIIIFFNGFGGNTWNSTYSATTGGLRLGEIAGCGTLPDGNFTETESVSVNFYSEQTFTGTHIDGNYTAPSNIVLRQCSTTTSPETITQVFDYNGNHLVGRGWSINGNAANSPGNSVIVSTTGAGPTNPGKLGIIFRSSAEQGITIQQSLDSGVSGHAVLFMSSTGAVPGSITCTSAATTYATTSDLRLKRDISSVSASAAAAVVDKIRVVNHRWRDGSSAAPPVIGMIAQELHQIVPEAVVVGDNGASAGSSDFKAWMRDDSKLVPYLVATVQDLRRRLTVLESCG